MLKVVVFTPKIMCGFLLSGTRS